MQILRAPWCRFLLFLTLIVNLLITRTVLANYAFGDSLFEDPKPMEQELVTNELSIDGDFSATMHACVETLCKETSPKKTFKQLYSDITYKASKSDFYEVEIKPIIEQVRKTELEDLEGMKTFIEQLAAEEDGIEIDLETRKAIAVLKLAPILSEYIPTVDGTIELGPLRSQTNVGILIGRELDIEAFNRLVAEGVLEKISIEMAQNYLLFRNYSSSLPFIGNSDIPFANLVNNYGKGSRNFLLSFYDDMIEASRRPGPYVPYPMREFIDADTLEKRRNFFDNNFASIVRFTSLSPFSFGLNETDFGISFFNSLMFSVKDFLGAYAEQTVPAGISRLKLRQLESRVRLAHDLLLEQLEEENFHQTISQSCEWKLNYLKQGLPTEEELKKADQQVNRAIVEFQSWLYENFSDETTTSMVNFLKSWEFFFPPSQEEFAKVVKEFIEIRDPRVLYNYDKTQFHFVAGGYNAGIESEMEKSSSVEKINNLCETLNIRPISDRTSPVTGQVFLSWMALKDQGLTRSVVWHELGHVLSGLIRGENEWNLAKKLLGEEFKFSLSVDSFLYYVEKRQCLGANQEQDLELRFLGEQFLTWAEAGELAGYYNPDLSVSEVESGFQISDLTLSIGSLGKLNWRMIPESEKKNIEERVNLVLIDGDFVEEDWADLVASAVGQRDGNHFCFMLKDRDHLYWEGEKQKHIQLTQTNNDEVKRRSGEERVVHSTPMYRLLHTHLSRSGVLPGTCQQFLEQATEYKNMKSCR